MEFIMFILSVQFDTLFDKRFSEVVGLLEVVGF